MATKKQIRANRLNGRKGGPRTPQGKAVSRLNARRHGVLARVPAEGEARELHRIREAFAAAVRPGGAAEEFLVGELARVHLALWRCARAEAEHLMRGATPGARFSVDAFERVTETFGRYDRTLTNRLLRLLRELEELQAARQAENAL